MNNNEKIIKYIEGDLSSEEKIQFEKEFSQSKDLQNELAAYKKVLGKIDEQNSIEYDSNYFVNLIPSLKDKLNENSTVKQSWKFAYTLTFILILTTGYLIFTPFLDSSSNNILTVNEFANKISDDEINELINYLGDDSEDYLIDEDYYNPDETELENIILSSSNEIKIAIISEYAINDLTSELPEFEKETIYNELIDKNFSSEVNL